MIELIKKLHFDKNNIDLLKKCAFSLKDEKRILFICKLLDNDNIEILDILHYHISQNKDFNLKIFRKLLEKIYNKLPTISHLVLLINSLCQAKLYKKCLSYIESITNEGQKQYINAVYLLARKSTVEAQEFMCENNLCMYKKLYNTLFNRLHEEKNIKSCLKLYRFLKSNADPKEYENDFLTMEKYLFNEKYSSLVVACMNREKNLLESLESWLDIEYIKEYVIVDYSSKVPLSENNKIKEWQSKYNIKVIRVDNEQFFNLGKAYNVGVDFASFNNIIKIDSDYKLISSSWLDHFFMNANYSFMNYFIRGDYEFSMNHSGFFIFRKEYFPYFREDLNGYGYDEIDVYNRIKQNNKNIKEIIWFNIADSIEHLPHENSDRSSNYKVKNIKQTEEENRNLCNINSPSVANRKNYVKNSDSFIFEKNNIDKIFCINIEQRTDRWKNISIIPNIERFNAVHVTSDFNINNLDLKFYPCNISSHLYFFMHPGAYGAYMSHYLLWNKIVKEKIKYALILEDDVDPYSIINLLDSNLIYENHEFVQLSKRTRWKNDRMLFDGGESYILSLNGAKKLIQATQNPLLLENVYPEEFESVDYLIKNKKLSGKITWSKKAGMTCPVDKFMGYCCENSADKSIKLNSYMYPYVNLDLNYQILSNINLLNKQAWDLSYQEVWHKIQTLH